MSPFKMVTVDKLDPPFSTSYREDVYLSSLTKRERKRTPEEAAQLSLLYQICLQQKDV